MGSDPQYTKFPDLSLSQDIFNLSNPQCPQTLRQSSLKKLQHAINENKMAPLYRHLAHPVEGILNASGEGVAQGQQSQQRQQQSSDDPSRPHIVSNMLTGRKPAQKIDLPWDEKLYESLVEDNNKELEALQKEETEADEAAGETEVMAARGKRAEFWTRVADKVCG